MNKDWSEISLTFSRNINLFWNKQAAGAALLIQNQSVLSFIKDCVFFYNTFIIKPIYVYQSLDGR